MVLTMIKITILVSIYMCDRKQDFERSMCKRKRSKILQNSNPIHSTGSMKKRM
jgi:hypothetical protein